MKIIIGGAGAVGTHLAELLSSEKQDIILMDEDKDKLSAMDSNFDLMTVCASPTSIQALKNAGVDDADLFIAVTPESISFSNHIESWVLAEGFCYGLNVCCVAV